MPLRLAVVAEARLASLPPAADSGAGGASRGDNSKGAVGSRAPSGVWILCKHSPHHQRLVEQQQALVFTTQKRDVIGMHAFSALKQVYVESFSHLGSDALKYLRTLQVDPAFLDFNPHILLQAIQAELVATIPQLRKLSENWSVWDQNHICGRNLVRRSLTAKITYLDSLTSSQ